MQSAKRVTISFDEWSDRRNRRFIGINCTSWLNGALQKFCLDVVNADSVMGDSDHLTGALIAQIVMSSLTDHNVTDKVYILVTDRGSSMKSAAQVIQKDIDRQIIHGHCICHLINSLLSQRVRNQPAFSRYF